MRDMRDPEKLGVKYMEQRLKGLSIEAAVKTRVVDVPGDESCIERYGSANDVKPKWMEVQVK